MIKVKFRYSGHAKQKAQISHIKGKDIAEEYVNRDVCDHAACTSMQSYKGHLTPLAEPFLLLY